MLQYDLYIFSRGYPRLIVHNFFYKIIKLCKKFLLQEPLVKLMMTRQSKVGLDTGGTISLS